MIQLTHLETDVTTACQLSCVACNHHVPLYRQAGPYMVTVEQVESDLTKLASITHFATWAAIGGEPLLHRGLVDILRAARASKVADRIEVWTNGLRLRQMGADFWRSFDILVLSVYEGKLTDDDLRWVLSRCSDEGIDLEVKDERVRRNFRALFEAEPTNEARTLDKFRRCFFRQYSRVANWGYFFTCCCAPHMPRLIHGAPLGTDGVAIDGLTEDGLRAYLERAEPLSVCSICAGGDELGHKVAWHEEREPLRWIAASTQRARA